jgi:hypothetical protein
MSELPTRPTPTMIAAGDELVSLAEQFGVELILPMYFAYLSGRLGINLFEDGSGEVVTLQ